MGISTACLYPQITETSLKRLISMGYVNFEIFINCPSEMDKSYVNKLKKILGNHCRVCSIHPFTSSIEGMLFFSDYQRRFDDGMDFYKRYFELAANLGAGIFVLHGQKLDHFNVETGRIGYSAGDELYFERYLKLFEAAKNFGVTVCQENVRMFRSARLDFIRGMKSALKENCAFVFDIKQCIMSEEDPMEMIKTMGSGLNHFHLSDSNVDRPCLLPGFGSFDFKLVKAALEEIDFCGAVITEVYSSSYEDVIEILASKKYAEQIFI